jgi:hypothetical protein
VQHRVIELEVEPCAQLGEDAGRVEQQFARIEYDRGLPLCAQVSQEFPGAFQPGIGQLCVRHLDRQRRQHFARVADQNQIGRVREKTEIQIDEVVRHVLEEQAVCRVGPLGGEQIPHDGITILVHHGEDLVAARVVCAGDAQVVAVKRLVEDTHIVALRKAVHQGGRDVARSRPEANRLDHCRVCFPRMRAGLYPFHPVPGESCALRHKTRASSRMLSPI